MSKVLFVATVVKTHINTFHLPYIQWFQEQGWETHVAARNDFVGETFTLPYCDQYYNLPFSRLPLNVQNIRAYKELKKLIEQNQYDIIHCHTPVGGILTRLAARNIRKKGTKVIYTAHGFHFFKGAPLKNWLLYYPMEKLCARFTDVLITVNHEDFVLAQNKMKADKVFFVPGVGVDIEKFSKTYIDRVSKRGALGIPENATLLLSVGELIKRKNHAALIRAVAKLQDPNIYLIICGEGKLHSRLSEMCVKLSIEDHVKLLGFRLDMPELFHAADIFVFPSFQEGLPVALIEAMASALPVICSNIRGNADLIKDGVGGYLVRPQDIERWAEKISDLRNDASKTDRMKAVNLKNVQRYALKNILEEMKRIYEKDQALLVKGNAEKRLTQGK